MYVSVLIKADDFKMHTCENEINVYVSVFKADDFKMNKNVNNQKSILLCIVYLQFGQLSLQHDQN